LLADVVPVSEEVRPSAPAAAAAASIVRRFGVDENSAMINFL